MEAIRHAPPKVGRPAIEVTPLMRACERGISEVAMFLIEQGANIRIQNKGSFTLVHSAACVAMVDVLGVLDELKVQLKEVMPVNLSILALLLLPRERAFKRI